MTAEDLKIEKEDKEGITFFFFFYPAVFPRCGHRARNPRQGASLYQGSGRPRWLVFLFPAPAEGRLTSGVVKNKKKRRRRSCPSQFDAVDKRAKPRTKTNRVTDLPVAEAKLVLSMSSPRRCEAVKLLQKTEAEFVKGLVYMYSHPPPSPLFPHRCNFQFPANLLSLWRSQVCPRAAFRQ